MKINFNIELTNEKGMSILSSEKPSEGLTLGDITCQCLLAQFTNDNPDGNEKNKRYKLWADIKDGGEKDIDVEDVARIKKLIGIGCSALIVGQCWELLEGR